MPVKFRVLNGVVLYNVIGPTRGLNLVPGLSRLCNSLYLHKKKFLSIQVNYLRLFLII